MRIALLCLGLAAFTSVARAAAEVSVRGYLTDDKKQLLKNFSEPIEFCYAVDDASKCVPTKAEHGMFNAQMPELKGGEKTKISVKLAGKGEYPLTVALMADLYFTISPAAALRLGADPNALVRGITPDPHCSDGAH